MTQNPGPETKSPRVALGLEYPLALPGGVSVLVRTLVEQLPETYEIVLISPDDPSELPQPVQARLSGHVRCSRITQRNQAIAMTREIQKAGVNLAHFHSGGVYGWGNQRLGTCPIPYLNRAGIPCLHTVHLAVSPFDGYCGPQRPLLFKLALFPLAYAAKLHQLAHTRREIAVSRHDERCLRRWYFPFRSRFKQIYHSTLSKIFKFQVSSFESRSPIVLSVGHIAFRKGQHVLAEAFCQIADKNPEWQLWMAGHKAEKTCWDEIERHIAEHRLEGRIKLLGARSDTADLMARASIFVQPSIREALGLALQEALWLGCPAIGSDVGGIPELIENGRNGLLVPPENVAALAQTLEQLMTHPEERKRLAQEAHNSILEKRMTAGDMLQQHLDLYRSYLAPQDA